MTVLEALRQGILILDGGMGTLLQECGLRPGELPELWNLSHPEVIEGIHRAYFDAGSNVVNTNTFGANPLKFDSETLRAVVHAAIDCARAARDSDGSAQKRFIALDIGPSGKCSRRLGTSILRMPSGAFPRSSVSVLRMVSISSSLKR